MLGLKLHQRARSPGRDRYLHPSEVGLLWFHPCHRHLIKTRDKTTLPIYKWRVKSTRAGASLQLRGSCCPRELELSRGLELSRVSASSRGSKHGDNAIPGMPIAPTRALKKMYSGLSENGTSPLLLPCWNSPKSVFKGICYLHRCYQAG